MMIRAARMESQTSQINVPYEWELRLLLVESKLARYRVFAIVGNIISLAGIPWLLRNWHMA